MHTGLACLADFDAEWNAAYTAMTEEQRAFLAHEAAFRSADYRWPSDALNNWSRVWEYPYVRAVINRLCPPPAIYADIGSGVTFFPFSLARDGGRVICADIDPICGPDIAKAGRALKPAGTVEFRQVSGGALPFHDGEVDCSYSISVIEHLDNAPAMADELIRITKPGGLIIITMDIGLSPGLQLAPEVRRELLSAFADLEEPLTSRIVHPLEILTSANGPRPMQQRSWLEYMLRETVKRLMGREPGHRKGAYLAVEALVYRKPTSMA